MSAPAGRRPGTMPRSWTDQELETARAVLWVTSLERALTGDELIVRGLVDQERQRRAALVMERFGAVR